MTRIKGSKSLLSRKPDFIFGLHPVNLRTRLHVDILVSANGRCRQGGIVSEKIHGNPENAPQTTREEKPQQQVDPATLKKLGETAIKGSGK